MSSLDRRRISFRTHSRFRHAIWPPRFWPAGPCGNLALLRSHCLKRRNHHRNRHINLRKQKFSLKIKILNYFLCCINFYWLAAVPYCARLWNPHSYWPPFQLISWLFGLPINPVVILFDLQLQPLRLGRFRNLRFAALNGNQIIILREVLSNWKPFFGKFAFWLGPLLADLLR